MNETKNIKCIPDKTELPKTTTSSEQRASVYHMTGDVKVIKEVHNMNLI